MPKKPTRSSPNAKERRGASALASIALSLALRACQKRADLPLTPVPGQRICVSDHRGVYAAGMQAGAWHFASRCCQLFVLLDIWLMRTAERGLAEPAHG